MASENDKPSGASSHSDEDSARDEDSGTSRKMYLRFAAMIATGMFVMYWTMFAGTYEWSHIQFSQSRLFMALVMGGTMGLVMLAWMMGMYRDTRANLVVVGLSILLIAGGVILDRTQATVGDRSFMRAMIPHHSLAITRSERFNVDDARVCDLAVEISEAQRREILEMEWLINDIGENGVASTAEAAKNRPVPKFSVSAETVCDPS